MDVLIVDVDCAQLGIKRESFSESLRNNNINVFETPHIEKNKRDKERGFTYVVRLWCRTRDGQSICVLICDPWSTTYRLLEDKPEKDLRKKLDDLKQSLAISNVFINLKLVFRKTTSKYELNKKDKTQKIFPWIQIQTASKWYFNEVWKKLIAHHKKSSLLFEIKDDKFIEGESRVEVYAEALESMRLKPGGWLHLSEKIVKRVAAPNKHQGPSCDLVVQVLLNEVSPSEAPGISAIRVLSWDIECYSATRGFPNAAELHDSIIAIGLSTSTFYSEDKNPVRKVILLGTAQRENVEDDNFEIVCCSDERGLLMRFMQEVTASDADMLVGYNTYGFDWKYIRDRMKTLRFSENCIREMQKWSRVDTMQCQPEEQQLGSMAMGDNPLCYPRTPGRVGVDLWFYLKRQNSPDLPNLKLNTVSMHYLEDQKEDLPAKEMFNKFVEGPSGRYEIAKYCIKDCDLVLRLMHKLAVIPELFEMAKVTGTIPEDC